MQAVPEVIVHNSDFCINRIETESLNFKKSSILLGISDASVPLSGQSNLATYSFIYNKKKSHNFLFVNLFKRVYTPV
jgi:hypothetical protein